MIELTIRNKHDFLVTTTHDTRRSAEFQRTLSEGGVVEVKPVFASRAPVVYGEQKRKPRTKRRPA